LCSGPGKLCEALAVTGELDGRMLTARPFKVMLPDIAVERAIGPRIGITKAADVPWRFGVKGSRYLSKPFPKA
jgi:DNA-3-methyladenine glycosylase